MISTQRQRISHCQLLHLLHHRYLHQPGLINQHPILLQKKTLDDPLCGVKVPCIGDQLTRIRFAGAKDLRAGAHTNRDRLDHLYPFRIAAWHTKRSFLKVPMVARYLICRCPLAPVCYQIICARRADKC